MVMRLKTVTFVLENCEMITMDGKYIGDFLVDDIHSNITRIACNAIEKTDIADTVAIEIHKNADANRDTFDEDSGTTTFKRLMRWDDVTQIEFELEEQYAEGNQIPCVEHYHYFVNWTGDDDMENEAQTTYLSAEGNLYLVIAANKSIEDFFNLKAINDSESMCFHWEMYDMDTLEN